MSLYYHKITWSGDAQTLVFGTPVDNARGFDHMEQEIVRVPGTGEQDSWTHGIFQRAKFSYRWIPASGTATNAGWHFPAPGVKAWLAHARQHKDTFTLYPDKDSGGTHTCRLVSVTEDREDAQPVLFRVDIEVEDTTGKSFAEY